jgi:hypothetical protein
MRAHGVPNFPDPGPNGGVTVVFSPGSSTPTIDGITFSGPAFAAAEKVCQPLGHTGGPSNPPVPEKTKRAMLAVARCMRAHGLPYTDPQFPSGGGIFGGGATSPTEGKSPAFIRADHTCYKSAASVGPG